MKANYHTHTIRCQHAEGTEEEYIENAIKSGFKVLGFSDHAPMPYPAPLRSRIRMDMSELSDYVDTLLSLREKYRDSLEILIGFEAEYLPRYFDEFISIISDFPIDYLIQGQHFVDDEFDGFYAGTPTSSEDDLAAYVDLTVRGMKTGAFSYLAHPDLIHYTGDRQIYQKHMSRICEAALELDMPLEINMLGFMANAQYPNSVFFTLARDMGCRFILGNDAHKPKNIRQPETIAGLTEFISSLNIKPQPFLDIRRPF